MKSKLCIAALLVAFTSLPAFAQQSAKIDPAVVERYVKSAFPKVPEGWQSRVDQDETQRVCTQYHNEPPKAEFDKILAREKAAVVYPADGKVIGNWKEGQKVAQNGRGGQFSDPPGTVSGGNCYGCHQLSGTEVSFGTLGPSLRSYGKDRKFDPAEAKLTYAKIYNSNSVLPCSNMPRFGYHKVLTEQQIKDAVAYLFDPESPVNK
ncbi:MAG: sulfur oxidation c-type cytochrome SoxX [Rhodospirillales bacterium]|nr:sulfur oxidation c-type cytochrome SoxX [Rhodospirillales bacterium]